MDQGNGTPARYIECMEFFLAPYPIGGAEPRRPDQSAGYYDQLLGTARLRKVVRPTRCKLLLKPKPLLAL